MNDLQKAGAVVALVVGLGSIGTGVWKSAIFFTNMDSKLTLLVKASENNLVMDERQSSEIALNNKVLNQLERDVHALEQQSLMYLVHDQDRLTVKLPMGNPLVIPLHNTN